MAPALPSSRLKNLLLSATDQSDNLSEAEIADLKCLIETKAREWEER